MLENNLHAVLRAPIREGGSSPACGGGGNDREEVIYHRVNLFFDLRERYRNGESGGIEALLRLVKHGLLHEIQLEVHRRINIELARRQDGQSGLNRRSNGGRV